MHSFDAHFHIIAPGSSLIPNRGFILGPFGVDEYLARVRPLGLTGGAVVAGSFQGEGQDWLIAALARLGPGWAGVAQLPEDTPETEILRLDGLGVRALRLNLYRGTHPSLVGMARLARRAPRPPDGTRSSPWTPRRSGTCPPCSIRCRRSASTTSGSPGRACPICRAW